MRRRGGAAPRTSPLSILQYALPQDEPLRNPPTSPATSRTRHGSSSAGSTHPPPPHAATSWPRASNQPSLNSSLRAAAGRAAAESSNKPRNFAHSSWFFFSRFHIPASLPLLLSTSISALLCLTYHSAPGPKESHLHRIAIQVQNFRDLLDRVSFHFLQDQHEPVTLDRQSV